MAEAIFNSRAPDGWTAESAGIDPWPTIAKHTVSAMSEIGLSIGTRKARKINDQIVKSADKIVVFQNAIRYHFNFDYIVWTVSDCMQDDAECIYRGRDDIIKLVDGLIESL